MRTVILRSVCFIAGGETVLHLLGSCGSPPPDPQEGSHAKKTHTYYRPEQIPLFAFKENKDPCRITPGVNSLTNVFSPPCGTSACYTEELPIRPFLSHYFLIGMHWYHYFSEQVEFESLHFGTHRYWHWIFSKAHVIELLRFSFPQMLSEQHSSACFSRTGFIAVQIQI